MPLGTQITLPLSTVLFLKGNNINKYKIVALHYREVFFIFSHYVGENPIRYVRTLGTLVAFNILNYKLLLLFSKVRLFWAFYNVLSITRQSSTMIREIFIDLTFANEHYSLQKKPCRVPKWYLLSYRVSFWSQTSFRYC